MYIDLKYNDNIFQRIMTKIAQAAATTKLLIKMSF